MYLLVCLAILGTALGVPLTENVASRNLGELYVLPTTTFPTFYDVRLFLDPGNTDYFFGNVSIRILANTPTDRIVIHAMEMIIDRVTVISDRSGADLISSFSQAGDDTHFLTILLTEPIQPLVPHTVHINYVAQYAANMFGVYVSTYQEGGNSV